MIDAVMQFLSFEQCLGYVACVLGITAFLQKNDTRLKSFLAAECAVYAVHFWLLNNTTAAMSALVSGCRSAVAVKTRSLMVAMGFIGINLVLGALFARSWMALLPVSASVLGTLAVFLMKGIPMRIVLLVATLCWLINNIAVGSIGGTVLESFVALANSFTLLLLLKNSRRAAGAESASIAESYPRFSTLPRGVQQLLLTSEKNFMDETKAVQTSH